MGKHSQPLGLGLPLSIAAALGVPTLFLAHATTNSWEIAFRVVLGIAVVGLIAYGFLTLAVVLNSRRPADAWPYREEPRKIGWGSRVLVPFAALAAIGGLTGARDAGLDPVDRVSGALVGCISAALVVLALTGVLTRIARTFPLGDRSGGWIAGLLLVSVFAAVVCYGGASMTYAFRERGVVADATVTGVTTFKQVDTYFMRYVLPSGKVAKCSTEDVLGMPDEGDRIEVIYDPEYPNDCQSADYGTGYGEVWAFGAVAVVCAAAAFIIWALSRRRQ